MYKCTEAGINSSITVPSKVGAPRVLMTNKTQIKNLRGPRFLSFFFTMKNERARALPAFPPAPSFKAGGHEQDATVS